MSGQHSGIAHSLRIRGAHVILIDLFEKNRAWAERITRRDPGGRWDVRITEFHPIPFITIHARTRNSYEPDKRVTFHLLGGDMRVSEGEWRLTPRDNGRETLVEYDAAFALNFAAPRFLIDRTAAADFPTLLRHVERESLARTGQR